MNHVFAILVKMDIIPAMLLIFAISILMLFIIFGIVAKVIRRWENRHALNKYLKEAENIKNSQI